MQIIDHPQNSPEWYAARSGVPTASAFKTILASGRGSSESKTRATYMRKLAAEIITGEPLESFCSPAMQRGHDMEDEARDFYAFLKDVEPQRVGFVCNHGAGCSPDSFISSDGLLEIKTQRADLLIETLMKDEIPSEHVAQIQGQLWITERDWCDLLVFWPAMPPFIKRARRNEAYITKLASEVARFSEELSELVEKVKRYGGQSEAQKPSDEQTDLEQYLAAG